MRRTFLILLLAAYGCTDEDKPKSSGSGGGKNSLVNAPSQELPPPMPPSFGRDQPAQVPQKTASLVQPASVGDAPVLQGEGEVPPVKETLPEVSVRPAATLNGLFQAYGQACFGLDWRFLRQVAEAESGLDPKNRTGKHVGLFQIAADEKEAPKGGETCEKFIAPFKSYLDCSNLEDPEVNTAVAAHRFDRLFKGRFNWQKEGDYPAILDVCPKASAEDAVALAYVGHNNGPGVLRFILSHAKAKGWCSGSKHEEAVRAYYRNPAVGNDEGWYEKPEAGKEPKPCHNQAEIKGQWSYHCVTEEYGVKKWRYGLSKVVKPLKEAGVEKLYTDEDREKCPALQVPPRRLLPKS